MPEVHVSQPQVYSVDHTGDSAPISAVYNPISAVYNPDAAYATLATAWPGTNNVSPATETPINLNVTIINNDGDDSIYMVNLDQYRSAAFIDRIMNTWRGIWTLVNKEAPPLVVTEYSVSLASDEGLVRMGLMRIPPVPSRERRVYQLSQPLEPIPESWADTLGRTTARETIARMRGTVAPQPVPIEAFEPLPESRVDRWERATARELRVQMRGNPAPYPTHTAAVNPEQPRQVHIVATVAGQGL